ncbi:MAG: tetratricopeptide repeat protein, partial [candidate division WOR-3 bacterium]
FFVFSRYRIPSLSFILPYAGLGLTKFWEKLRTKAWRGMRNSLMVALPVLIFTLIPVKSEIEIKIVRAQCIANLATRYYQEDSVARAIFYFNRALTVAPYHTNSLHDLGVIYYFKKDYARAEDYLSRCLRIEPDHYAANFFLARVYEDQGRLPEALEFYKKAQKVQPGNLEIQFNIATVLQKQGRYIEAIAIYNEMLRIAPDDPRIFHNLSVAYFYLKDYRQARINLDRAKDLGMVPNQAYEQALIKALSQ